MMFLENLDKKLFNLQWSPIPMESLSKGTESSTTTGNVVSQTLTEALAYLLFGEKGESL